MGRALMTASTPSRRGRTEPITALVCTTLAVALSGCARAGPPWDGPHRNFTGEATSLADTWPDGGPERLWGRDLGDGYSSIVADGQRLSTYCTDDEPKDLYREAVVALDPTGGKTFFIRNRQKIMTLDLG